MSFLRDDIEFSTSFTVSQKPCKIKMDQNESPYDLPEFIKEEILKAVKEIQWNRYPQPSEYYEVKEIFSEFVKAGLQNVALTFGGDQTILSAFWIGGGKGRKCLIYEPTYPIIRHYAIATSTPAEIRILGEKFEPQPEDFKGKDFSLIIFVSPNNPTGNLIDMEVIKEALDTGSLVFVDEAYYPFSKVSAWDEFKDYPNLMVGRSLSKSLLAGMRMGYVLASEEIIKAVDFMNFAPYNLTTFQLAIFKAFGKILPYLEDKAEEIIRERERVYRSLIDLGYEVFPSKTNFLLFKVPDAKRYYEGFINSGIRIRDVSRLPGLSNHLRVTICKKEENDEFLKVAERLINPSSLNQETSHHQ